VATSHRRTPKPGTIDFIRRPVVVIAERPTFEITLHRERRRSRADAAGQPQAVTMPISVIVTTYNRPDALRAVLAGLGAQVDRDFEVLVADDGLRDDTGALACDCA
jgi:hypothetical protein